MYNEKANWVVITSGRQAMSSLERVHELIQISQAFEREGKNSAALQHAKQALEIARALNHSPVVAEALVCLAKVRFRMGKYAVAAALSREARDLAEAGSPALVDAWQVIANCAAETNSLDEAEAGYLQAAELARESGYSHGQTAALHGIAAGVYLPRGQFDLALAAEQEVLKIFQAEGKREYLYYPMVISAMAYVCRGESQKAAALIKELASLTPPGSAAEGYRLCLQAELALGEGAWEEAQELYQRARSNAEATGEPWLNINVRLGMSRCYRLMGAGATALQWAMDACQYALTSGYSHEHGKALIERGQVFWQCDQLQAAEEDFQAAMIIPEQLGAAYDLAHARLLLAALLSVQKHAHASAAWRAAAEAILAGGYGFLLQRERRHAFPLVAKYLKHPDHELAKLSARLLDQLEKTSAPALRVGVLGDFVLFQGSHPISGTLLKQRQAGELFRLLLISPGRRLSREQVIDAMWPDKSPAAAINFFHQATSALRHALEPDLPQKFTSRYLIVVEGQAILHLPPGSQVDYEQFEEHLRRGEWEQAVALWRGEPFIEDRYRDWAAWKREQLTNGYLRALLALAKEQRSYALQGNSNCVSPKSVSLFSVAGGMV